MIYGYLSDTALAPLGANNTTYMSHSTNGTGVCQLTERVMSMFNTDMPITDSTDKSPGLLIDPRSARSRNLFSGAAGADTVRADGVLSIHYDRYLTHKAYEADPATINDMLDLLATGTADEKAASKVEISLLFTVIETITLSHTYDAVTNKWVYLSNETLNANLRSYSTNNKGKYGYRDGSVDIATMDSGYRDDSVSVSAMDGVTDKTAKVRNITDNSVVDTIGSDATAKVADVIFADYISFKFRFSRFDDDTTFVLYLNPETMLRAYPIPTITHIVMPLAPEVLCSDELQLTVEENGYSAIQTISMSSASVMDVISNELYKSDLLQGTNYTGSVAKAVKYRDTEYSVQFACIYRGRTPDNQTCFKAIYDALLLRLTTMPNPMTEEEAKEKIDEVFPTILSSTSFVIIPFYDSYVETDLNHAYAYSRNVFCLGYLRSIVKDVVGSSNVFDAYTTMIGIPGYGMHGVAIAEIATTGAEIKPVSAKGLDSLEAFQSYQPLSSVNTNWITMTPESQKLANYLAVLVGAELVNSIIPPTMAYVPDERVLNGVTCSGYSFTAGGASFFVLKKRSYEALVRHYYVGA